MNSFTHLVERVPYLVLPFVVSVNAFLIFFSLGNAYIVIKLSLFVNWNINLRRLFNAKVILVKEQQIVGDNEIPKFLKNIILKVSLIAWFWFELVYLEAWVQHFDIKQQKPPPACLNDRQRGCNSLHGNIK